MAVNIDFADPFDVQIAQARAQNVMLSPAYYSMAAQKRAYAQTASGLARLDQVQRVADELARIQASGGTLADFKKWAKTQDWTLPKGRLETIYRNSVQTAYQAGHWRDFEENAKYRPYLMYDAINDSRTRPSHLALDGIIKPVGDAFWLTHAAPMGHRCRCAMRSLTRAEAMAKGGVTQNAPAEGQADEGWGYKPTEWGRTLKRIIQERQASCKVDSAQFGRKQRPVAQNMDCTEWGAKMLVEMNADVPAPTLKQLEFWGQRPGLADLPPVPVVELTGNEFGAGLRYLALAKQADAHLRKLQKESGLLNVDTGWLLKINGKGRKKMGDNADQSASEIKAVAGIDQLARWAVVAERHFDERHNNPFVISVLRLYAPLLLDGVMYLVRLTVKDYGDPRMLHALSAIEIENALPGILPASGGMEPPLQQAQPTTGRAISISDLLKNAILEDGKPYEL